MRTLILVSTLLIVGCAADKPSAKTVTVFPDGWTMTIEPGLSDYSDQAAYDSFLGYRLNTDYPGSGGSFAQSQQAYIDRSIRNGGWRVYPYRDMNTDHNRRSRRSVRYYVPITRF